MSERKNGFSWKWPVIIVTGLVVIGIGIWFFMRGGSDAPQYQTAPVERGELTQTVMSSGTLNPVLNVLVGCQVSGRISKLYADFNTPVTNGQLIAEIDPRNYEAQVASAKADVANARANLELQKANANRSAELFTNKLLSSSDYETAIATCDEAEASVEIKQAALSNAMANLGYCKIYSPVDGVIISRNVDVGQTVAASLSAPTLFQIGNDLAKMQIDANVDEADIGGIVEGQKVDFTVDAYPNRTFHGVVSQVRNAPTTLNNVVTYDAVITVSNSDLKLKPGMTANVSIIVSERNNALEIPNSALRFQPPEGAVESSATNTEASSNSTNVNGMKGGGRGRGRGRGHGEQQQHGEQPVIHTVYVLRKDADGKDKLEPVQIKTGITDNIYTEVLSGLKEGDQIVTGLQIPGLTADQRMDNPFSGRRHF